MTKNAKKWHLMSFCDLCQMTYYAMKHRNMGIYRSVLTRQICIYSLESFCLYFFNLKFIQLQISSSSNFFNFKYLQLKLQLQTSTSNFFKLQLQTSTSNFNSKFPLQIQTSMSNSNFKLQLQSTPSNFNFKPQHNILASSPS